MIELINKNPTTLQVIGLNMNYKIHHKNIKGNKNIVPSIENWK
jgi:hypothetical protein